MTPNKLSDWNLDTVKNIVSKGYFETISFDLKEKLPDSRDGDAKDRLIKSCCAFANQAGGFLIFGIKDGRGLEVDQRIVGIESTTDFPEKFGNYPQKASPNIEWDFLNPPIVLDNGNKIHIVEILESKVGPIGFESDGKWIFTIRTNKGNGSMSYDQIKHGFVNIYEKRIKLNLLASELESIIEAATNMFITEDKISHHYSLYQFNIQTIENVLFDTYSILANSESLLIHLNFLRSQCKLINNKMEIFWKNIGLPLTNIADRCIEHNRFVNERLLPIKERAETALEVLKDFKLRY